MFRNRLPLKISLEVLYTMVSGGISIGIDPNRLVFVSFNICVSSVFLAMLKGFN